MRDRGRVRVALVALVTLLVSVVMGLVALAFVVLVVGRRGGHVHDRGKGVAGEERERMRGLVPARVEAGHRQAVVVEVQRDHDRCSGRGRERDGVAVDDALRWCAREHCQTILWLGE